MSADEVQVDTPAKAQAGVAEPAAESAPEVEAATHEKAATKDVDAAAPSADKVETTEDKPNGAAGNDAVKDTVEPSEAPEQVKKSRKRREMHPDANLSSKFEWPESSDPHLIREQVEYYFSDNNLPTDAFLLKKVGGAKNMPVPLSIIASFKRMRRFQPYSAVVDALKASTELDIAGEEGSETVVRKEPLSKKFRMDTKDNYHILDGEAMPRIVYMKGFGDETARTQYEVEELCNKVGPQPISVRLRRDRTGLFKGSVFVTFDTEEHAKDFRDKAITDQLEFHGTLLDPILLKTDYIAGKIAENGQRKRGHGGSRGGRGAARARGARGGQSGGSRGGFRGGRGGRGDQQDRNDAVEHHSSEESDHGDGEPQAKRVRTEE